MSRMNRHRQTSLSVLILAAALACERDKQDSNTASSATTEVDETSSTGGTTTTGTTDILADTTESVQTAGATGEPGDSNTTGSEPLEGCAARLTKDACHIDHEPQGLGYEFCLWVNIVTWDANTACPDLATGEGTCIMQDFTNDCSHNPTCTHKRTFARLVAGDIYEAFAHPEICGTPLGYELCSYDEIEPVCSCFGCQ